MYSRLSLPVLLLGAALAGSVATVAAQELSTQSSNAAGVTVKATPRALTGAAWEFDIAFDTHTQDLNDDPAKSAALVADGKRIAPAAWRGDPPGGHHRKGVLRFDAIEPRPQAIELVLTRAGEPKPRSFRWRLN